ncbi:MAG TPA: flavodoxin family protein [Mobilitalea sp.]|nr:flavodoxin family protein [Mobilitalea sp.]
MNKITAFIGSLRKNGNTTAIVNKIIEGLTIAMVHVEIVLLSDYRISGCMGYCSCRHTGKCVLEDNMTFIYPMLEQSGGYIFATPAYIYNVTSDMKALLDRMFCYYSFRRADGQAGLGNQKQPFL